MSRAKEIGGMRPAEGVKIVQREIPGAIPLQQYFYQNLNEDWLPFLEKEGLFGEPLPDEQGRFVAAPGMAGRQFLIRMASSGRDKTRKKQTFLRFLLPLEISDVRFGRSHSV
jgi:hypothetical protein